MAGDSEILLKQLFGSKQLEEISIIQVEGVVDEFPFFNAGHYFLSKKLQVQNGQKFEESMPRTALYFNNPFWLQWLLQQKKDKGLPEIQSSINSKADPVIAEQPSVSDPYIPGEFPEKTFGSAEITHFAEAMLPAEEPGETSHSTEMIGVSENGFQEEDIQEVPGSPENTDVPETILTAEDAKEISPSEPIVNESENGVQVEYPDDVPASPGIINDSEKLLSAETPVDVQAPAENAYKKIQELGFEPYYTVDYFASQGIKLKLEDIPDDKLGKQLKTFTDWLKTMKRLPLAATDDSEDDKTIEATIEVIAAHSIEEKDVVTETMADVLAKQGKTDKAVELYQKLSLLNPSKSAYFAAKIEQLKVL